MANSGGRRKVAERIAEAVRAQRARRQMSQQAVATKAGVSASRLVEIENAQTNPRIETVDAVCVALGLRLEVVEAA